jgi:hypothetical protein
MPVAELLQCPNEGEFGFAQQLTPVISMGSYDYSLCGLAYGMLNIWVVALSVPLP